MLKKLSFYIVLICCSIFLVWGITTVNLVNTEAFNSMESERYVVNYEEIKEKVGIDLEAFSKDDAFIKIYDNENGFLMVLGKYYFNLENNKVTNALVDGFHFLTDSVNNINKSISNIFY